MRSTTSVPWLNKCSDSSAGIGVEARNLDDKLYMTIHSYRFRSDLICTVPVQFVMPAFNAGNVVEKDNPMTSW
jgi:hypothetical protein